MTRKAKKGSKRKRQKAGLNRSILDVGWGMLKGAIKYKVEEGGGVFVDVPTKTVKPSQTCPKCLHQEKKELDVRTHNCPQCGYVQDRDLAAAEVMILWASSNSGVFGTSALRRGASSSTTSPKERKHCGSMKQLGAKKRQKHHSAGGDSETPPPSVQGRVVH